MTNTVPFVIPFFRYGRDGAKTLGSFDTTQEIADLACKIIDQTQAEFAIEVLGSGELSLTCEYEDKDCEIQSLGIEICPNNSAAVNHAVIDLVKSAASKLGLS